MNIVMSRFVLLLILFSFIDLNAQSILKDALDVKEVPQEQSNWCWAASTAMVLNYYNSTNYKSCDIASKYFQTNTCNNPSSYNRTNSMLNLKSIYNNEGVYFEEYDAKFAWISIRDEIDKGNPLVIRVENSNGEGHDLVIFGYEWVNKEFNIWFFDPMAGYSNPGSQTHFLSHFDYFMKNGYENLKWTHTAIFWQ